MVAFTSETATGGICLFGRERKVYIKHHGGDVTRILRRSQSLELRFDTLDALLRFLCYALISFLPS